MSKLLVVNASARRARSISRDLSRRFVEEWKAVDPMVEVIDRDVGVTAPSVVTEDWIAACFTDPAARTPEQAEVLAGSDTLIGELERADVVVIATPMYNYGLPAALKCWLDQVIRVGKTFSFDLARGDYPLEPILTGKTLVCLASKGEFGFAPGGIREHANHLEPHLRTASGYLGVSDPEAFHAISVEYQEFGDARHASSRREAARATTALAKRLAAAVHEPA